MQPLHSVGTSAEPPSHPEALHELILQDVDWSTTDKTFPTYMNPGHYTVLLSWVFQLTEELQGSTETQFRAKQILDFFLGEVAELKTDKFQLAAAVAIRIAFQTVQSMQKSIEQLLMFSGGGHSQVQFETMQADITSIVQPKLNSFHSPFVYCSDLIMVALLPYKFRDLLPLMTCYVAIHPSSYRVNPLSIFLAVLKHVSSLGNSQASILFGQPLEYYPELWEDCDIIMEQLVEMYPTAGQEY